MVAHSMTPGELETAVERCQIILSHAWMVRTFVKHSPEAEEFPELMLLPRTVFDVSRSLESRKGDPEAYFRQLGKKLRRLKEAAEQFTREAPLASTHTNFQQAAISYRACVDELAAIHRAATAGHPPLTTNTPPDPVL